MQKRSPNFAGLGKHPFEDINKFELKMLEGGIFWKKLEFYVCPVLSNVRVVGCAYLHLMQEDF